MAAGWVDAYLEHGCNWWDWAAAALIATEAGAVVRVPGPTGSVPPDDGLGADARARRDPGIAAELAALAARHGAADGLSPGRARRFSRSGSRASASTAGSTVGGGPGAVARCRRCRPADRSELVERVPDRRAPGSGRRTRCPPTTSTVSSSRVVAHQLGARQEQRHRARRRSRRPGRSAPGRRTPCRRRGRCGSLSGGAASANPRSPNWAATRFAWPRCPPALSTRTLTDGRRDRRHAVQRTGGQHLARGPGPATGVGQARSGAGPDALTSTDVQVTRAAAASTVTTAITGPRRRRW